MQDLVKLIQDNPGCRFMVDNDGWWMEKQRPSDFD